MTRWTFCAPSALPHSRQAIDQTDQMKLRIVSGVTSKQRRLRDFLHNGGAGKVGASEAHADNAEIIAATETQLS